MSVGTDLQRAVDILSAGGVIAFPTETVYGLGADAERAEAVARIFAIKQRPRAHPLIVHLAPEASLDDWAIEIPDVARRLTAAAWPGPLTVILRRGPRASLVATGGGDTIGLRVPANPMAKALLRLFGGGIAAPSANRFGAVSPTTAAHVVADLGDDVLYVLDGGPCDVGLESTIVDLSSGRSRILRPGMISAVDLGRVLGRMPPVGGSPSGEHLPRVSGSLESHYAPRTPLLLAQPDVLIFAVRDALAKNERLAVLAPMACPISDSRIVWCQAPSEPAAFARDLYANLRALDAAGCSRIVVQKPPQSDGWQAVNDRLRRAAASA